MSSKSGLALETYLARFRQLHVDRSHGAPSPHKPCLLLSVIELAETANLLENKIYYGPALVERFSRYIKVARPEISPAKACYPMVYLRSDGFWNLHPKSGRELNAKKNPKGGFEYQFLRKNIEFALLDEDLHKLLLDTDARSQLRDTLIETWLSHYRSEILEKISQAQAEFKYEQHLASTLTIQEKIPDYVRKPVFRRSVLSAYDHCCAATGLRFLMPDGTSLLEAAHIKPFAESHDDRTINGIALEPTIHRAMDHYLIAPSTDLKWHVSNTLDVRSNGHQRLIELDGKDILLPREEIHRPDKKSLKWRLEEMRKMDRQRK